MKEFYDILDKIKDNLRANPSVNTVTFGNLTDLDLDKTTIFPLSHVFVTNAIHNGNTLDFEVNVLCMDIVDVNKDEADGDDFYGNDNLHDVLNTQLATLNSLISDLKRGSLYKDKYQLVGNPTLTPFKERFSNVLAGWEASINISVKNEAKIGLCADTADNGGAGGGAGGGGDVILPPSVLQFTNYRDYITLGEPLTYQILTSNNPTSYSAVGLPEGLTLDTSTGIITGTPTGLERIEEFTVTVSNSAGSDTGTLTFYLTNDTADDLLAPYNLTADNITTGSGTKGFTLRWVYRDYNGDIDYVEVYRNGVLFQTVSSFTTNPISGDSYGSVVFVGLNGVYDYTVKVYDTLGNFSGLSESLTVDSTTSLVIVTNESVVKTNPTLSNVVSYYKLNSLSGSDLLDEQSVNNLTSERTSIVLRDIGNNAAEFDSLINLKGFAKKVSPVDLSFTNGTQDQPFSVSFWFKFINGSTTTLVEKIDEWVIKAYTNTSDTTKCDILFELYDASNIGETFNFRRKTFPPTSQVASTLISNQWNHIVVTNNGNANLEGGVALQVFVNNQYFTGGSLPPSAAVDRYDSMKITGNDFVIGADQNTISGTSVVQMDELAIFNKVLSKDEINYLYNDGNINTIV